jgi:hypothetical protein
MQLFAPHLLYCLSVLRKNPTRLGVNVEGAEVILGITLNEFYHSPVGLKPEEPVGTDFTKDFFIGSHERRAGACSVSQLDFVEPVRPFTIKSKTKPFTAKGSQKLPQQIFRLVTNSLLALLGLRKCDSHQCAAYMKPFTLERTPMHLCFKCEETLLRQMHQKDLQNKLTEEEKEELKNPSGASRDLVDIHGIERSRSIGYALVSQAATRYKEICLVLERVSDRLNTIQLGHRRFKEFEEECDWLHVAGEIVTDSANERFRFSGTNGPQSRRRCLLNCLREAHERQPGRTLHRIHSQPLLKRTCLADMAQAKPYCHDSGDLHKWTTLLINRGHKTGGHYVEIGGSLKQKTIGPFVESGLNAAHVAVTKKKANLRDELRELSLLVLMRRAKQAGAGKEELNDSIGLEVEDPDEAMAAGNVVCSRDTFKTRDGATITQDMLGIVASINADGSACIEFEGSGQKVNELIVLRKQFHKLQTFQVNDPADAQQALVALILSKTAIRDNQHSRHHFYGTDILRSKLGKTFKMNGLANTQPVQSRLREGTEEWKPQRARKNAHTLSYTCSLPSLVATV